MNSKVYKVHGAGLGLRRDHMKTLSDLIPAQVGFWEVAPENWIGIGGAMGRWLRQFSEKNTLITHGLSLNIGGPAPLDEPFLKRVKNFLDTHQCKIYSEHLSYCADDGHLYDLMPIPFTDEAVDYVAERIHRAQDILQRRLVIENVSYYAAPGKDIEEIDFINAILQKADCDLLLDINNIYVNSINHGYDAEKFLTSLPPERIAYFHIAGHYNEAEDLIVDTHGSDVIEPVWKLLDKAYQYYGVVPTLLERDFNIPPMNELLNEVDIILDKQQSFEQIEALEA